MKGKDNYFKLFKQLKFDIIKSVLLGTLLDSIIFFIILHTFISLLALPTKYVLFITIPTGIIFSIGMFKRKYGQQNLRKFEERNPTLKEILRTANEYRTDDSLMTHAMFYDLFKKVKTVSTGTLIQPREIYTKYLVICFLSVVMVSIATVGTIDVTQYSDSINGLNLHRIFSFGDELEDISDINFTTDERIYGDPNVASLGNEQIDLQLSAGFGNNDFSEVKDAQEDLTFKNSGFPVDAELEASENNVEGQIEETALARAYLKQISK